MSVQLLTPLGGRAFSDRCDIYTTYIRRVFGAAVSWEWVKRNPFKPEPGSDSVLSTRGKAADGPRKLNQLGLTHLSFRVTGMADLLARVVAAGGSIREDSRIDHEGGTSALFVHDPDGTCIELIDAPGDPAALPTSG